MWYKNVHVITLLGLIVWLSWGVVDHILKLPSWGGLQKNHTQLLFFNQKIKKSNKNMYFLSCKRTASCISITYIRFSQRVSCGFEFGFSVFEMLVQKHPRGQASFSSNQFTREFPCNTELSKSLERQVRITYVTNQRPKKIIKSKSSYLSKQG